MHPAPPGLDSRTAAERLTRFGPNQISDREERGFVRTLRGIATEPMFLLLLLAAAVYLAIGDLGEGLLLAAFALLSVGLVVLQERRSEHALAALRELAAPQVRLWRDGRLQRLPAHDIVPGDLLQVGEGERIAADGIVREAVMLAVDESLLTGESVPVRKQASTDPAGLGEPLPPGSAGGDDQPWAHAGTLVVSGHARIEVLATGGRTRMGGIGASLAGIEAAATPLQAQLKQIVRWFGLGALLSSGGLLLWWGLARGDWLQGLLSGIAMGMAMLPEEFPMALAVFLGLGAWRLARLKVLARRPAVIEALGAATLLCVDKTGTLTENRMRLARLRAFDTGPALAPGTDIPLAAGGGPLPEAVHPLLEYAMLASRRGSADPMDRAILAHGDQALADTEHLHPAWLLEREYPLTPELLAMSQTWTGEDGHREIAAKGAPEAIAALCHLNDAASAALLAQARALATAGLRVLAVARGRAQGAALGETAADDAHDYDFGPLGLLGFEDPLRPGVAAAVAQARAAGIGVAMITGDHVATALAIAAQAGLATEAGALTGTELEALDQAALAAALQSVRVFARVMPDQKLRLVQAFAANGHTVAMTGDGVNDAPALKAAPIGIAMGLRGTDVAREAAGIVLLDEDFGRIVAGVRMGRRIFDNLQKVMTYITAIHVPIAGLALLPVLFGLPPLMLPAHVVLTEMVIDPVCSLAFEGAPEEPGVMQRPPRRAGMPLIGLPLLLRAALQGGALLAACLAIYALALQAGQPVNAARTLAVVALTAGNLGLVALNLCAGIGPRALLAPGARAFWIVAGLASAVLALAIAWAPARGLLQFALPS